MTTYTVNIFRDTTQRVSAAIGVPANSPEEAIAKAKEAWERGDFALAFEKTVDSGEVQFLASIPKL